MASNRTACRRAAALAYKGRMRASAPWTGFLRATALELRTTIDRGDGRAIRPYVCAGIIFIGHTSQVLFATFACAPAAADSFTTTSEFHDTFADIEAGLALFHEQHGTVSVGHEGRFSDHTQFHDFFVEGTQTF